MSVADHLITTCMGVYRSNKQPDRKKFNMKTQSIEQQAIVIADFIHKRQVLGQTEPPPDSVCETISYVVDEFLSGNSKTLSAVTDILDGPEMEGKSDEYVIAKIFDSMFADGKINWGRIGVTYAFGVKYSLKYSSTDVNGNRKKTPDDKVLRFVGKYVGETLGPWISKEGGWDSVVGLFPNQEVVAKQLRSAGFLILTVGIGSLLNVLTS